MVGRVGDREWGRSRGSGEQRETGGAGKQGRETDHRTDSSSSGAGVREGAGLRSAATMSAAQPRPRCMSQDSAKRSLPCASMSALVALRSLRCEAAAEANATKSEEQQYENQSRIRISYDDY